MQSQLGFRVKSVWQTLKKQHRLSLLLCVIVASFSLMPMLISAQQSIANESKNAAPNVLAMNIEAASSAPAAELAVQNYNLPLSKLGEFKPVRLQGVDAYRDFPFSNRVDEVVTSARLQLNFIHSPALLSGISHLKVYVNDDLVATLPINKEQGGMALTSNIELDPNLLVEFNRLRLRLIGHYTLDHCEDPWHNSLWLDVDKDSRLEFTVKPLNLANDLALLPMPFFDRHDSRRLVLPVVLPSAVNTGMQQTAAMVSSWFGALASYRHTRFPVYNDFPANQHAVVFSKNPQSLGLDLPEIKGPTLAIRANPKGAGKKLLLVLGRSDADLQKAALALVSGNKALSGAVAFIQDVKLGPDRVAYDAPNWIRTDRPVHLGEMVQDPAQLEALAGPPDENLANRVRIALKLPPDLLFWRSQTVPLDLKYRHMPPSDKQESLLTLNFNDRLVHSFLLQADDTHQKIFKRKQLAETLGEADLKIPGYWVSGDNQMEFRYHLAQQKMGECRSMQAANLRVAVDPDSTIDFSSFNHYIRMPDLRAFASSGYPFTKYADLQQTAIVVPTNPTSTDLETLFAFAGNMGRWSGLPAYRLQLLTTKQTDQMKDKDLLLLGGGSVTGLLESWGQSLPALVGKAKKSAGIEKEHSWSNWWYDIWQGDTAKAQANSGRLNWTSDGLLAAAIGFESPYSSNRSVIAITASANEALVGAVDRFEDPATLGQIRGDLTLMRLNKAEGFTVGEQYYVGDLPWWKRILFFFYNHPVLLAIIGVLAGILLAYVVYSVLLRRYLNRR